MPHGYGKSEQYVTKRTDGGDVLTWDISIQEKYIAYKHWGCIVNVSKLEQRVLMQTKRELFGCWAISKLEELNNMYRFDSISRP